MPCSTPNQRRLPALRAIALAAAIVAAGAAQPAPVFWIGPDHGYWDMSYYWSPGLPGAGDDVILGSYNLEFRGGPGTINSLKGTGGLTLSGGTLSLANGGSHIGTLALSNGTLTGNGNLTVTGASIWLNATMSGAGNTLFQGDLSLNGSSRSLLSRSVTFGGNTNWSAGAMYTGSQAAMINTGVFTDSNTSNIEMSNAYGGAPSAFINNNTFRKQGNSTTTIGTTFDNHGVVTIDAGTLALSGGGNSSGSFTIANGATLSFAGNHGNSNLSVGGGGTMQVTGGTFNAASGVIGGALALTGGTFSASGSVQAGTLNLDNGTLSGAGSLSLSGASSWHTGVMSGTGSTSFNGDLTIDGGNHFAIQRKVNLGGATTWLGGSIYTGSGASFNNSGMFTDSNNSNVQISNDYGGLTSSFNNSGTYHKTGSGITTIANAFNSSNGVVRIDAGTLALTGGGASSVTNAAVADGATLLFSGNHNIGQLISSGSGAVQVAGGTLNASGAGAIAGLLSLTGGTFSVGQSMSVGALNLDNGSLGGAGILTVNGASAWHNGVMNGTGATVFQGALAIDSGNHFAIQRNISFQGNTSWSAGSIYTGSGASFNNTGDFSDSNVNNVQISNDYGGAPSSFSNSGRYHKTGGGVTTIAIAYHSNGGSTEVDAGTLALTGGGNGSAGNFAIAGGATLSFAGNHSIANLHSTGSGTLQVMGGTLSAGTGEIAGLLSATGGTFSVGGPLFAGSLNLDNGAIAGAGTLTVSGPGTWRNGSMNGTGATAFNGELIIDTGNHFAIQRSVSFNGDTSWAGGSIYTGSGASFHNRGTFTDSTADNVQISNDYGGQQSSFNNEATYRKTGSGITTISNAFNNSGVLVIERGTLALNGGGQSSSGAYAIANGATLAFSGNHTVSSINSTGAGKLQLSGGSYTLSNGGAIAGLLSATGGSFNTNGDLLLGQLDLDGGGLGGSGTLSVTGSSSWRNGAMNGSGSTVFGGELLLASGTHSITQRSVTFGGATLWTDSSIYTGSGARLANTGDFSDNNANNVQISNDYGGAMSQFQNSGTYRKLGGGATSIYLATSNSGVFDVSAGKLLLNGSFSNYASHTLTGGSYRLSGTGVLGWNNADIYTNAASITLDGSSASLINTNGAVDALAHLSIITGAGSLNLLNGRTFNTLSSLANAGQILVGDASLLHVANNLNNSGALQLAGGTVQATLINNGGALAGYGVAQSAILNSGQVRASGGTLVLDLGASGSGLLQADAGASLQLGANTSTGTLLQNGSLDLGNNSVTVSQDYNNANFGVGNNFDRRAGVTGAGLILAGGSVAQQLSGLGLSNGASQVATLDLGTLRVGESRSGSFIIHNVGSGASLRGAIQTTGLISNALSGSGVTAQNWGPIAAGGASTAYTVTFNPLSGGTLNGQSIAIVNNFDNVAGQTIKLSGSAWNVANPELDARPILLAAQRVGGNASTAIAVENTAPADGYSERLNASISAAGAARSQGAIYGLAAGDSSGALRVGVDTSTAGIKNGSVSIAFSSDGAGTSGLSAMSLGTQQLAVSGKVYAPAVAQVQGAVDFGVVRVGDTVSRNLIVSNTASGALTDTLRASLSTPGNHFGLSGATTLSVAAGASATMRVNLDTSQSGQYSATSLVKLTSHNNDMTDLALTGATVGLRAIVNQLAVADLHQTGAGSFSHAGNRYSLDFGNLNPGSGDLLAQLSVLNAVLGQADALQGSWEISSGSGFTLDGPLNFSALRAGDSLDSLTVHFDGGHTGVFDEVLVLKLYSTNASDPAGRALDDISLHLSGKVVAAVPEPDTYLMLLGGLLLLGRRLRRRR